MKNAKKNEKKQIDAEINRMLLSDFDKIESFVVSRWKEMFIGAAVIIVLVAIAYGIMLKKDSNLRAAQRAIANAATETELIDVINKYSSYSEVDFARIRLAKVYADKKDFAKAGELYKKVAQNTQSQDLKCQMLLDEAYMKEKAGDFAAACKAFMVIADNSMYAVAVRAEAYYSAARLYAKENKKDERANALKKLLAFSNDDSAAIWVSFGKVLQAQ